MIQAVIRLALAATLSGCAMEGDIASSEVGRFQKSASPADVRFVAGKDAEKSASLEAPPTTVELIQRQVIYTAGLRLVVVSTADAMNSVTAIAKDLGGYLQESDARSITIRVPADKFEPAVAKISTLGEVVDRSVKASDVTEAFADLQIRLDNAKKTRDRLLAHLAKTEKMEDTIKLEAEITRVSTTIEEIEGKLRLMNSQIALSTIRVEFNATQPQNNGGPRAATPFAWVAALGDGLVAGNVETMPRQPRFLAAGPKFDPPKGFVRYFSSKPLVEAMDADGVRIKVQRQDNFDKAPLEFWQKLARKALVEGRAIAIESEGPTDGDASVQKVVGTREVAGQAYGYLLVMARTNDDVYTFETWAPKAAFEAKRAALIASAKTLRK